MVKFPVTGTKEQARMFLRVLSDDHPQHSDMTAASRKMKVVVPANSILAEPSAREAATRVTLTFFSNIGNLQIQTSAILEDDISEKLVKLEKVCCVAASRRGC